MALNTSKCNHLTPVHFKGLTSVNNWCLQVARINELETENAALRERVTQLDERTNTLSKEIVRAKFRGQQQVNDVVQIDSRMLYFVVF